MEIFAYLRRRAVRLAHQLFEQIEPLILREAEDITDIIDEHMTEDEDEDEDEEE